MGKKYHARKDLLKIPDHIALKYANEEVKRLEARIENQKVIITNQEKSIAKERRKMEVLKEQMEKVIGYSSTQSIFSKVGTQLKNEEKL